MKSFLFRRIAFVFLVIVIIALVFVVLKEEKKDVFAQAWGCDVNTVPFQWGTLSNSLNGDLVSVFDTSGYAFIVQRTISGCSEPQVGEPHDHQTDTPIDVDYQVKKKWTGEIIIDWTSVSSMYWPPDYSCAPAWNVCGLWCCQNSYDLLISDPHINVSGLSYGDYWISLRVRTNIDGVYHYYSGTGMDFTIPDTTDPICDIAYNDGWEKIVLNYIALTESDTESGISSGNVDVRSRPHDGTYVAWGNTDLPDGGSTINGFNFTGADCTDYQFRYKVTDNAGNISNGCDNNGSADQFCNPGWTTKVDITDPTAGIFYSVSPGTICQSTFDVNLSDNDGCSGVSGGTVQKRQRTLSGAYGNWLLHSSTRTSFSFTGSNGYCYQFRYKSFDTAGNSSIWATGGEVCIDTSISPAMPTLIDPPSAWLNYNPNFKAQVSDPGGQNVRAHFNITRVSDGSTVLADGQGTWVSSGDPSGSCYPFSGAVCNAYSINEGQYNWRAYAEDTDNCTGGQTANRWLGIDKSAPTCTITHSPASPDANDGVTFDVSASDTISTVASIEIFINGASENICPNSTVCSYAGGPYAESPPSHTYSATIIDAAGNTGTCSGAFNVQAFGVSVGLTASPNYGAPGFSPALTAIVGGSATGPIDYTFDCHGDGYNIAQGDFAITTDVNPYIYNGCSYPGNQGDLFTARVDVTREGTSDSDTINLYLCTMSVTPNPVGTNVGNFVDFLATYDPDGPSGSQASQVRTTDATWSSPDEGTIVDVDYGGTKGRVYGLSNGSTTVTAVYNSCSDTADIAIAPNLSSYRVLVSGLNRPPTISNLNVSPPADWCGTPGYVFSWTYSDPDNDTQSRFDFRIDTDSNFPAPVYPVSRSSTGLTNSSPYQNIQSVQVSLINLPDNLTYGNQTYYWQANVYDSNGTDSGWTDGVPFSFQTRPHRYPSCDFTWSPNIPSPDQGTNFIDNSTCYDDIGTGSPCEPGAPYGTGNDFFEWTFQNGSPPNYAFPAPEDVTTTFLTNGDKQATLRVTDSNGNSCSITKTIRVNLPLPKWKEILPW